MLERSYDDVFTERRGRSGHGLVDVRVGVTVKSIDGKAAKAYRVIVEIKQVKDIEDGLVMKLSPEELNELASRIRRRIVKDIREHLFES